MYIAFYLNLDIPLKRHEKESTPTRKKRMETVKKIELQPNEVQP
jgi:hypothetical protein